MARSDDVLCRRMVAARVEAVTTSPVTPSDSTEVVVDQAVLDACQEAWREHQQRCEEGEPYTDSVTTEELLERIAALRADT